MLVAVGLGAVVAASASAYTALKVVGATYVVWLGIQAIRHRGDALARAAVRAATARARDGGAAHRLRRRRHQPQDDRLLRGLPAAVHLAGRPGRPYLALLGLVFGLMAVASDSTWAVVAGRARLWFARRPSRLDTMSTAGGVMMIGLGATMAATE